MRACKVDERQLGEWIDAATGTIRYMGPGLTEGVAEKLIAAEKRTGQRNHVLIELDDEMDRSGFGQTAAIRKLQEGGVRIQCPHGLRIAAFACPGVAAIWSPIAERVDSVDRVAINGVWMEGPERDALRRWLSRTMGVPATETKGGDSLDRERTPPAGWMTRRSKVLTSCPKTLLRKSRMRMWPIWTRKLLRRSKRTSLSILPGISAGNGRQRYIRAMLGSSSCMCRALGWLKGRPSRFPRN